MEVFENDDTISHVMHIVPIDIYVYTCMCMLCAIHFHSAATDKCYLVQSSNDIPANMAENVRNCCPVALF